MEKVKAMWTALVNSEWLKKSVTIPMKLVVIGCAVAFVLLVAGLVHREAQPRVNALLGLSQSVPVSDPNVVAAAKAIFEKLQKIEAKLAKLEAQPKRKAK